MTALAAGLFAAAVFLFGWSYAVYPVLLRRLARRPGLSRLDSAAVAGAPSVEVLVSAAEEEAAIEERVRNLLSQETPGPLRVSIGCDGSRDGTADNARRAGDERVRVTEFPERRGKAAVLNDLVAASSADVLVFTDANTRFERGAIAALCRTLAPERVGAACGTLVLDQADGGTPEGEFWDRETEQKELEGRLGLCLGANGAIYAAKRSAVAPLPPDTTSMDDFLIPLGVLERGGAVVFSRDAVAREPAARSARAEVSRRFRIGIGAGQVLRRERWLWNARRRGLLSLIFFSRKTARWLAPVALLFSAAAAAGSPIPAVRWTGLAALALALLVWASASVVGSSGRGIYGRPYYFAVINLALAAGVLAGLAGYSRPAWKAAR